MIDTDGTNGSWWCPALRDIAVVAWSRDGSSLAILSQTPKIGFHFQRSFIDVCSAKGVRHVATIDNTTSGIGWINNDTDLVFLSTTTPTLTPEHVWTVAASGGTPLDRTPTLSATALDFALDADGKAVVL